MASGKKNYFRHSFYAGKDDKIVNLITDHGKQAYFHYFRLVELCGEQASESMPEKFVFHRRTLCAELMVTNSRLGHHLLAMQSSLLLHYVMDDRKVEILMPNLVKYMGKYESKNHSNTPNKRKEKKRKEKEIKVNEKASDANASESFNFDAIYQEYPRKEGKTNGINKLKKIIKNQDQFSLVLEASKKYNRHCKDFKIETRYIKLFSTWVNGEHWNDVYERKITEQELADMFDAL
jgi:hypothetical protein